MSEVASVANDNDDVVEYSFEEICLPLYDELRGFARKLTGDITRAEDIVQDTMERALLAWDDWEPICEIHRAARGWLFKIVSNTFTKEYRRGQVRQDAAATRSQDILAGTFGTAGEHIDVTPDLCNSPFSDEVKAAVEALGSDHREVLERYYVEGETIETIAVLQGCPKETVRTRLHRARLHLGEQLGVYAAQTYGLKDRKPVKAATPAVLRRPRKVAAEAVKNPETDSGSIDGIMRTDDTAPFEFAQAASY